MRLFLLEFKPNLGLCYYASQNTYPSQTCIHLFTSQLNDNFLKLDRRMENIEFLTIRTQKLQGDNPYGTL